MIDPYASGVLQESHHARLVANLDTYARDAGIQPHFIWTTLVNAVSETEIEYFKAFRRHRAEGQVQGLCYVREAGSSGEPEKHMSALAGALVRNFIRARVMTLGTVLDALAKKEEVEATCLLVPNFHLSKDEGGSISAWQVQHLYDLLVQRGQAGVQTVIYTSDLNQLRKDYGLAIGRLIENNFITCEI